MARSSILTRLTGVAKIPRVAPTREAGVSGTAIYGGFVRSIERSTKWVGQQRYVTSSEIVTNVAIVAASVHHFLNLLAHPKWTVRPADDESEAAKEAAEFVEDVLFNRMETPWPRIVRRAGMFRFHGFGIQEWTAYKRDDGKIGFVDVEARPQHTIDRWEVDESGKVTGVWQRSPQTGELLGLPRSKIVYIVDDSLTDSPEGLGIFRHLAESYDRLKQYLELEARAFERDLRGIPIGRAPLAALSRAVEAGQLRKEDADRLVEDLKTFVQVEMKKSDTALVLDSQPFEFQAQDGVKLAGTPQWGIELLTGGSNGLPELAAAVDRLQREMARVIGTEHLMMGDQGGNRALSADKSRNLYLVANAVLGQIVSAMQKDLVDTLWTLNGFDEELKPTLAAEDVAFRDVAEVTAALRELATAGAMLSPDDPAINDVREMIGVTLAPKLSPEQLGALQPAAGQPPSQEAAEAKLEERERMKEQMARGEVDAEGNPTPKQPPAPKPKTKDPSSIVDKVADDLGPGYKKALELARAELLKNGADSVVVVVTDD